MSKGTIIALIKALTGGKLNAPATEGTSGQVLVTDGNGGRSWGSVAAGEVVIDSTLEVQGAAADAKAVGDALSTQTAEIADLNTAIGHIEFVWHDNARMNKNTGEIISESNISYAEFDASVLAGTTITGYTRMGSSGSCCFYRNDGSFISPSYGNPTTEYDFNYSFDVPADAVLCRITCTTTYKDNFTVKCILYDICTGLKNGILNNAEQITNTNNRFEASPFPVSHDWIDHSYIVLDATSTRTDIGKIYITKNTSDTAYNMATVEYLVAKGQTAAINGYVRMNNLGSICFYDKNHNLIQENKNPTSAYDWNYELTIPADAWYMRVSCSLGYKTQFTVSVTDINTTIANHTKYLFGDDCQKYSLPVYAPPQKLNANSSEDSDFNASDMTTQDIYDYLDALVAKYPNYLSVEDLGVCSDGILHVKRYIACRGEYACWQKANCHQMYRWVNGSTTIYSVNCSPRVEDAMYTNSNTLASTYGTVTSVDAATQTVTVGGTVFEHADLFVVEPELVWTRKTRETTEAYDKYLAVISFNVSYNGQTLTVDNETYNRYPMGDISASDNTQVAYLQANEHGPYTDPRDCAIVTARFIKDLCENTYSNNSVLNYIKNNVKLVVIPVANPWGFDDGVNGRYNYNGVNINRNYNVPAWSTQTGDEPKGAYAGSEIETQYCMNTMLESGAKYAFLLHCTNEAQGEDQRIYWFDMTNNNYKKIAIREAMLCSYNALLQFGSDYLTDYAESVAFAYYYGMVTGLYEFNAGFTSETRHDAKTEEMNYTFMIQIMAMLFSEGDTNIENAMGYV